MASLADFFPEEERKGFAERNIGVGTVIRDYEVIADKEKFFVVVGVNNGRATLATVLVNTRINTNVFRTLDQQKLHVKMIASESNGIFTNDCFVNCTFLHEKELDTMQQRLSDDTNTLRGVLTADQIAEIKSALRKADIAPYLLKRYNI
jgi:hypothetical protein